VSWEYKLIPEVVRKLRDLAPSAAVEIKAYLESWIKGTADPRIHRKALRHGLKGFWR